MNDTFAYYRLKLDGRFTAAEVLAAIDLYTDRCDDLPNPANLMNLMTPPAPAKVTQAEFIHAKEQWKLDGYPPYGQHRMIVKKFEAEQEEGRAPVAPIEDPRVLEIARNTFKRIA